MYVTTHNTFASAAAAQDEHKAAYEAACRSIVRCRKAESIADRADAIKHHREWMNFLGCEMGRLVLAA